MAFGIVKEENIFNKIRKLETKWKLGNQYEKDFSQSLWK